MDTAPGVRPLARLLRGWRQPVHRDGAALVSSSALSSLVGLGYWVLAARLFPPATVGVGSALVSTMMLLGSVGQLNLGVALLRFVPVAGGSAGRLVASCYLVGAAAATTAGVVFAVGAPWWAPELRLAVGAGGLVVFLAVAAPVWAVFVMQDYVLTALRRAVLVPVANLGFAVAKLGLLVAAAALATGNGIAVSWLTATALMVAVVTAALPRLVAPRLVAPRLVAPRLVAHGAAPGPAERVTVRDVARFAGADYVGEMCWTAVVFGLPVLVLTRLGAEAAATFGITWTIAYALYLVAHGMGQAMVAHLAADPAGLPAAWRGMVGRALALLVPAVAVLAVAAGPLLTVFGPHYAATGVVVLVLSAVSALPDVVVRATVAAARVQRRRAVLFGLPAAVAVAVLAGSWLLMPRLGLAGVGVALLGAQTLAAVAVLGGRRLGTR